MPFFSNLKKVLNLGASGGADGKKKRGPDLTHIRTECDPEIQWEIVGELGDGAFGKVHKVKHREKRDAAAGEALLAAAKICVLENDDELDDFVVEIDILAEISHVNVIKLYEAFFYQNKLWVSEHIGDTRKGPVRGIGRAGSGSFLEDMHSGLARASRAVSVEAN